LVVWLGKAPLLKNSKSSNGANLKERPSYNAAKQTQLPLLFKGGDFDRTDILR